MAPQPLTPAEIMQAQIDALERLVRSSLIENKNFQPVELGNGRFADGVYFTHFPTSRSYVEGPLKVQAETILKQVAQVRALARDMLPADQSKPVLAMAS